MENFKDKVAGTSIMIAMAGGYASFNTNWVQSGFWVALVGSLVFTVLHFSNIFTR